jgi:hypothetical protein
VEMVAWTAMRPHRFRRPRTSSRLIILRCTRILHNAESPPSPYLARS